ncbi:hypothetical protein PanWU01x14_164190 [Parasponia andersonii]|uniref:Uncharacterized protein n=1 Tax=Parasponia andersonii TaxID=3476 RepID=A0A2P5CD41_PARAD|nr:hypothetical protein PanWU01x14_164190 [Parasponia andersonii]
MFNRVDFPSDIDDCYRVDLVKDRIEDNALKEGPLVFHNHEVFIVHSVGEKTEKVLGNTNVVEAPPHSSKSNPPIGVIKPLLSSSNHHKPYKKDMRKIKKKSMVIITLN